MKPSIDAGKLRDVLQVLELAENPEGTWTWQKVRKVRGQVELSTGRNLFSTVGIGARGAEIILRRQDIALHNALLWGEQHLFLSAILPEGRLHLRVQAALVEPTECQADMDQRGGIRFPGILTEKYMKWEQPEPYSVNRLAYVLVTPKPIQLQRGSLVGVSGINYEVQLAHTLDPYKSEYEIVRTEDL